MIKKFSNVASNTLRISVIGAGPAGFYATQQLVKLIPNAVIDIYDRLPCPFGLVRFGVAPDHPEVKNVINTFTKTANHDRVNFFGNLSLGKDFTLQDLKSNYHIVLLSYGAEEDRKLNIPGENLNNVISARHFVGWYNGLPTDANLKINLKTDDVVIVGQGNVAVDVARILLSPIDQLAKTDITEHSLNQLADSTIRNVYLIGRRGPAQVAFTIKELRELLRLPNISTVFNPDDFIGLSELIPNLPRPRKRLTELLCKASSETPNQNQKKLKIIFKRSPLEILGNSCVNSIKLAVNTLEGELGENQKAVSTTDTETLSCGLVLKSVGYKSVQADPNLPFNEGKGIIKNMNGMIEEGCYCCGWVSTGPMGVILSTMNNAFATAQLIAKDVNDGKINVSPSKPGSEAILENVRKNGTQVVDFAGWEKIDVEEQKRGTASGKPRQKILSIEEMLKVAS